MESIRAITFDVGGTLIEPWPSVGHLYADVAARNGAAGISPEALNRKFATAWQAKRNFQHTPSDWGILVDTVFSGLLEVPPSRTFFPALYRRFGEAGAWRIWEDALPALEAMASRGIPMAVVSNWDERLRSLLEQLGLDGYFESIAVSCEVAFTKPSPVIFELAAQKLGIPPDQILHVGDSLTEDYEGALSAGFQSVLVNRRGTDPSRGVIMSLRQLESLV